jgi:SAM-dependent methyltransferase
MGNCTGFSVNMFRGPMPKFVVEFGKAGAPPAPDGRLHGPAFHRNHDAIWSAMAGFLSEQTGDVLELGSGTGQHSTAFAERSPHLTWWPSDIYPSHLASIEAWRRHAGLANLRAPQHIDLTDPAWSWTADGQAGAALTAMLCINVLHISPWAVAQNLIAGAGRLLRDGGLLFVYGPFMRDGAHTAPSNAAFDASLRAENPDWGVRDIRDLSALAQAAGLTLNEIVPMPANNLVLAFARPVRQR